jgi:hypothetical protein
LGGKLYPENHFNSLEKELCLCTGPNRRQPTRARQGQTLGFTPSPCNSASIHRPQLHIQPTAPRGRRLSVTDGRYATAPVHFSGISGDPPSRAGRHARARSFGWPSHGELAKGRRYRAKAGEASDLLHAWSSTDGDDGGAWRTAGGVAALQAWRRGGAEVDMVVACPELLAPAASSTRCLRPRLRPDAADDFGNLQLPVEVPLLPRLFFSS